MAQPTTDGGVVAQVDLMLAKLDGILDNVGPLADFERKTKIPKTHIVLGGAGGLLLLVVLSYQGRIVSSLIGFLYPAYRSFKAVESVEKDDDTQWLIYWTVYSAMVIVEFFTDTLLDWIPLYYLFKVIILLYLYLPHTNGAIATYMRIRPFLLRHLQYEHHLHESHKPASSQRVLPTEHVDSPTANQGPQTKKTL